MLRPVKRLLAKTIEDLELGSKLRLVMILAFVFALIFGLGLWYLLQKAETLAQEEHRATELLWLTNQLNKSVTDSNFQLLKATWNREGHYWSGQGLIFQDPAALRNYQNGMQESREHTAQLLKSASSGSKEEITAATKLDMDIVRIYRLGNEFWRIINFGGTAVMPMEITRLKLLMNSEVTSALTEAGEIYRLKEVQHRKIAEEYKQSRQQVYDFLIFALVSGGLLSWSICNYISKGLTARIREILDTAARVSASQPLLPGLTGSDELSQIDRILRRMVTNLEEAHRREQEVVVKAADPIFATDRHGRIISTNPAAGELWGYTEAEFMGMRIQQLVRGTDHEDLLKYFAKNSSMSSQKSKESSKFESSAVCKDGSERSLIWSISQEQEGDRTFCIIHDITDRKRAERLVREREEHLRLVMDSMPAGIVLLDEAAHIELTNPAFLAMVNGSSSQILGQSALEFVADLVDLLEQDNFTTRTKASLRTTGGAIIPIDISLTRLQMQQENKVLVVMEDITQRESLERMKQEFIAMVSHDLRSPLASLRLTLELVADGTYGQLETLGIETIGRSNAELERLLRMIQTLLDCERLESGQMALYRTKFSIDEAIEVSINAVNNLMEQKRLRTDFERSGLTAYGDSDKITQVLVNLISNAIKFSPLRSEILITAIQADADIIKISVLDQGPGIPIDLRQTIFERFKQVSIEDAREKGGLGLGLHICKLIIQGHGGTIGVDCNGERGSSFWFTLPITASNRAKTEVIADTVI